MPKRRALITGVNGQDGKLLAAYLLSRDYEITGIFANEASRTKEYTTIKCDITDRDSLSKILEEYYDEVYHLAGISYAGPNGDLANHIFETNIIGTENLLSLCLEKNASVKIFLAGSCAIFGNANKSPQNEDTRSAPNSYYGISKSACRELAYLYRSRGLFVSYGILYNHESVRRPVQFVTRKITRGVAEIVSGKASKLSMGDLNTIRDWGAAEDFVRGFHLILQAELAGEYILATGKARTVKDICQYVFGKAKLNWEHFVEVDPQFCRGLESYGLVGDITKITRDLGWKPEIEFETVLSEMLFHDMKELGVSLPQ